MKTPSKIAGLILSALVLASSVQEPVAQEIDNELAAQGEALAERLCAKCHAVGGKGKSPFAPAPKFRDLVTDLDPESLAEAFAEGIVVGHEAMPEFRFEPEQIGGLIEYLKTLQRR